jgi:NADPH:quinone reductase-like Zn-dependent oxidoreductase
MKAIVYTRYGPPEVLQLKEVKNPFPKKDEVLIRIYATTVTAVDCTFRKGKPFFSRLYTGLIKPKNTILGSEFAGEIEKTGEDVTLFKVGDKVFGTTPGYGSYTEYLCLPEKGATLAIKPSNLTYEEAAACDGFLTALPFLRDKAKIQKSASPAGRQKVLINGASGGVGSAAVQFSKYFGAEVTGVCSTANLELVKSLGADNVIDYTERDFTKTGETYDIIFDTVGKTDFSRCKRALKQNGTFLEASISLAIFPQVLLTSVIGNKKAKIMATGMRPPEIRTKDLLFIKELLEAEKLKPRIDRQYPIEEITEAHSYVDIGHKKGNVVITV